MRLTKLETEKLEKIRGEVNYRFRRRKGPTRVRAKFTSPAAWCEWTMKSIAKDMAFPYKIYAAGRAGHSEASAQVAAIRRDHIEQLRGTTYGPIISQVMARLYASYVSGPEPLGRGTVAASVETPKMDIKTVGWKTMKPLVDIGRPQLLLTDEVSP